MAVPSQPGARPRAAALLSPTLALALAAIGACGDDGATVPIDAPPPPIDAPTGPQTIVLGSNITADTTLAAINTYRIPAQTRLFVEPGATLTIEAGTTIEGGAGSALVVTRGAKIVAVGNRTKPITFTTDQPAGQKTPGYWGGLVVLGAAPINVNVDAQPPSTEAMFEGFGASVPEGRYGGTSGADNSGKLKYVRIQFAGAGTVADHKLVGLTLAGVGSATELDFVQVHRSAADGIALIGGTVNLKHLVASQNADDGLDSAHGWRGKGQFIVIQAMAPGPGEADGYESANHTVAASYQTPPRTQPTLYNVTMVGKHDATTPSYAFVLRRGAAGTYVNHLIVDFPRGLEIRDVATRNALDAGDLSLTSSIIFHNAADGMNWEPPEPVGDIDEASYLTQVDAMNRFVDPGLPAARSSLTAPDWKPAFGAAALTGGATPPTDGFFDDTATFVGALGSDDWTAGWTAYPQP